MQEGLAIAPEIKAHGAPLARRVHARFVRWCGSALGVLACAFATAPAAVAGAHATMLVSAQVLPVARLRMAFEPSSVQISAADVAAGFVDAPRPLELRIESNSGAGIAVDVSTLSRWYASVALWGFDGAVVLDGTEGTVIQRWDGGRAQTFALRARFILPADLPPGTYPWPLRFTARPL